MSYSLQETWVSAIDYTNTVVMGHKSTTVIVGSGKILLKAPIELLEYFGSLQCP